MNSAFDSIDERKRKNDEMPFTFFLSLSFSLSTAIKTPPLFFSLYIGVHYPLDAICIGCSKEENEILANKNLISSRFCLI